MALRPRPATLALFVAALGAATAWHSERDGEAAYPAAELARLVPGHRPLLGRGSLAMSHAPFDPAAPAVGPEEREGIYARLLAAKVAGVRGGEAALAAFYAKRGEAGDADRALAAAKDPVDRGVVLLALDRPDEALEEVAMALAERPGDPAALFDRALALEALRLDGQAQEAWVTFLAAEERGAWAVEARERLETLVRPVPPASPLDERKHEAWKELLDQQGATGLERFDALARELADAGDRLLLAELAYLRTLGPAGWQRRAREVGDYRKATGQVLAGHDADRALRVVERSPEPELAVKAVQFAAYSAIVRGEHTAARGALLRLRERCRGLRCAEELALVESDLGTLLDQAGDAEGAAAAFEEAQKELPAAFEGRQTEILRKSAELEFRQGAFEAAAHLADRAIAMERIFQIRDTIDTSLVTRAAASLRLARVTTAEAFLREAVAIARTNPDRVRLLSSSIQLGVLLADTGRAAESLALLEETVLELRRTALDSKLGWAMVELVDLRLTIGDARRARVEAEEAVELTRRAGWASVRAYALEVLAKAARATGDPDVAERSLREAVAIDGDRAALAAGPLARRRREEAASGRRFALARLFAERGASGDALEMFVGGRPPPLLAGECRIGLASIEGELVAFSLSAEGARYEVRKVGGRTDDSAHGGPTRFEDAVGTPWDPGRCPEAARRIAILQSPGAIGVPLAVNARRARPSALIGVALAPSSHWPEVPARGSALIVHSPTTDPDAGERTLPGGAREAESLVEVFGAVEELAGTAATPTALARRAGRHDLLQISAHGASRSGKGTASWLSLAGAGREGRLGAARVLELDLHGRRPLVVLASCRTAGLVTTLEQDGGGLPWAFLHSGASAVVATTEAVADDVAVAFSRQLHDGLRKGLAPAEAVTAAVHALAGEPGSDRDSGYLLFF
jgi:tetratricopeptide (TPR) repeat protein